MSIGCVLNISITKTVPFDTVSFYSGGADQARTDETVMVAGQVSLKKKPAFAKNYENRIVNTNDATARHSIFLNKKIAIQRFFYQPKLVVELIRLELTTPCLQSRCSTN